MVERPATRRLRILSFDPSLATRLDTSLMNEITAEIRWEDNLLEGPIGDYVEVVDVDPASDKAYLPVNLNDPFLLAQDGLEPSESNPQFHQQMVYAVAMTTIRQFERALGRIAFWADHQMVVDRDFREQFVRRLRIYPHALRDANAYYSPEKKALLFGYFPVTRRDADNTPGTIVFTCLSHDIIAHEVTHALLDGVHPRFNEPSNPDVLAFHEAFADIVALFQHFSYPEVLESQIRRTRGSLDTENLLSQLAHQFGKATGRGSALRDALGTTNDETKEWEPRRPDPNELDVTFGPHARGAILVAAIFSAFLKIYEDRSADLFRIATGGTGTLPEGEIHPDLTKRLAEQAAWAADRVLQICIRAIDYCPPVDITFGDFLRGLITADLDYAPDDKRRFRVAFIESFREWGIHPRGVTSMGIESLRWPSGEELYEEAAGARELEEKEDDFRFHLKNFVSTAVQKWTLDSDRFSTWTDLHALRAEARKLLEPSDAFSRDFARLLGLETEDDAPPTVVRKDGRPTMEVHSARPALRRTLDGSVRTDLVMEVTQRRRGYFDPDVQKEQDTRNLPSDKRKDADFWFRSGCTAIVDLTSGEVRWAARTHGTISNDDELARVRKYRTGGVGAVGNAFDSGLRQSLRLVGQDARDEPFAIVHQLKEERDAEAASSAERR